MKLLRSNSLENMIFQEKAKVIKNIEVREKYYKIVLSCPNIGKAAKPGQFVEIKVSGGCEPLLRRPFSIHRVGLRATAYGLRQKTASSNLNTIEILYEVVGKGSEILSKRNSGEYLDIIGPLGNGFAIRLPAGQAGNTQYAIFIAGGMGVAPLIFLAEKIKSHKVTKSQSHKVMVLIGAKTKNQILCEEEFKDLGCDVKIATDDGSRGFKGYVTDLLKGLLLNTQYAKRTAIYACGPAPMLKELALVSREYNMPAQISLEAHMACGIGACLGCVVNTREGFKCACKEGPVFEAHQIIW